MGSVDAEVEMDMEISDEEQEGRAVAGQVVDGRGVDQKSSSGPVTKDKADSSRKRKWFSAEEGSPSVHIEYQNLSRESRRKLQDLLRDWSLWQGYHNRHASSESKDGIVESGQEQYYPALQVGPVGSSFCVSYWVDKPAKQGRRNESDGGIVMVSSHDLRESEADVPLYDRVTPSLSAPEARKDGRVELEREAIRCFNCGSYSHGLRDCRRQLNYDAINSARSNHASKRNFSSGPRSVSRYYENHPSNEESDRAPLQLQHSSSQGYPSSNPGKESSKSCSSSEKKDEKNNHRLTGTEDNEEGEIVDGVGSTCVEEELYIAFGPEPAPQADKTTPDHSGARASYNYVSERMWRSPAAFSPPIQMHPNFHHQRSFAFPPQNPVYSHTPSPIQHHTGVNPPVSWSDERHCPQPPWDGRNLYYSENSVQVNGSTAPTAGPAAKKEDDDWELNFESSVYQSSESSRSTFATAPASASEQPYTPPSVSSYPALTVNTISVFTPPDPSQLSPTGSGYGDSFRPSPAPQALVQYPEPVSYVSPQVRELAYSGEAWEKAQAALSSLQKSDEKGVPGSI